MQKRFEYPKSLPTVPVELQDLGQVLDWISVITDRDREQVLKLLKAEHMQPGSNVRRAFAKAKLKRYCWSEELDQFYDQTDSFLYELLIWNLNKLKRQMRRRIKRYLCCGYDRVLKILVTGDGLGIDALYLTQMGHEVTYFEVGSYSRAFAKKLFQQANADVTILTNPSQIKHEGYDMVLCLDVLEHVLEPEWMVSQLSNYLRYGGNLITHAPFYMIHKNYPTHLKGNRKYCGNLKLYEKHSLRLVDGAWSWCPLVFEKVGPDSKICRKDRFRRLVLQLTGLYILLGRISVLPFLWIHSMRRRKSRWFGER